MAIPTAIPTVITTMIWEARRVLRRSASTCRRIDNWRRIAELSADSTALSCRPWVRALSASAAIASSL
jgi:hypothetical protein